MGPRYFALILGIVYLLIGLMGLIPGLVTAQNHEGVAIDVLEGNLLGIFPVNIVHNLFHFGMGVLGMLAFRSYSSALQFSRFLGVTLGILTIMGLIPALQTGFGLWPLYGHDIWLHGLESAIGIYLGFIAVQKKPLPLEKTT